MGRGSSPGDDMGLHARRSIWRQDAGKMVPNLGCLAAVVALSEGGTRIPIFTARGTFRFEIDGRKFRFDRLDEAEVFVAGWLLHSEGFPEGGSE